MSTHQPALHPSQKFAILIAVDGTIYLLTYICKKRFETVTNWAAMIGTLDFAKTDQEGNKVETPKFPYRLIFQVRTVSPCINNNQPNKSVRESYPNRGDLIDLTPMQNLKPQVSFF